MRKQSRHTIAAVWWSHVALRLGRRTGGRADAGENDDEEEAHCGVHECQAGRSRTYGSSGPTNRLFWMKTSDE